MSDEKKNGPGEPAASWARDGLSCHDHGVVERAETPEAGPDDPDAIPAGGGGQPEITDRPEVQQLLADMKAELKPGEDPLYYDWTNDTDAEGSEKAYISAAKPARARHITIDAKKVKIAKAARNPARLAKTERIRKGAPVPGAIPGVEGPAAAAPAPAADAAMPPGPVVSSEPPEAAAAAQPEAPAVSSEPPLPSAGSDPPVAQETAASSGAGTSEPPEGDDSSPWSEHPDELVDEISQEDLPSAHLPGLSPEPASTSGPPPGQTTEEPERRSRGVVVAVALLAVLGVVVLWWLGSAGDGDESDTIAVPAEPDAQEPTTSTAMDESAPEATNAASAEATSAASPQGATGGSAGEQYETSSTADTATPRPAHSAAPTSRPRPQVSGTHSKPELVEH